MSIDLSGLSELVRTLREAGVSHYEGTVPPDHRHLVKLGLRPLTPAVQADAKPAEPTEKVDAIEAAEKRLFRDG